MRFGIIGLGSMGKRRVRDLRAQGHDVFGFDLRSDRMAESERLYGIETSDSVRALLDRVDAAVVSAPPDQHVALYELCFAAKRPFFSEASIFTPRAEWFAEREQRSGVRGYPSGTWLHYSPLELLRARVQSFGPGAVLSLHHHYGGWLPAWHPWESYEDFYAGRRPTAAVREMVPFEVEGLVSIAGPVRAVSAMVRRSFAWKTDIDDQSLLLLQFESGLQATLLVELHQASPFRVLRVSCTGHALHLDFARHEVEWYTQETDSWRRLRAPGLRTFGGFNFEDVYASEIAQFAAAVRDDAPAPKSWAEDRHLSNVLFAAEESARRRSLVTIEEAERLYDGLTLDQQ